MGELQDWVKDDWVRIGTDGKIKGKCGTSKNKICSAGIAWAKRTFDTYPSAYANMAASKYCKDPNYAKKSKK